MVVVENIYKQNTYKFPSFKVFIIFKYTFIILSQEFVLSSLVKLVE